MKLRMRLCAQAAFLIALLSAAPLSAAPLSLNDCYQIALRERETLKQREQDIRAAEARYQQALAELFPQIGLAANQRARDNSNFGSLTRGVFNDPGSGINPSRNLGYTQFEGLVTLSQPIFRGFREFALTRASKAEQASLSHQLERDKQLLFLDVSSLYYQYLLLQDQEQSIVHGEGIFKDRINELSEFISLGKSRESEIHAAQAELAAQTLLKERTRGSKNAARELLASLLRLPGDTLELQKTAEAAPTIPLSEMLEKIKTREDIQAAKFTEQRLREMITAEERAWWPAINLDMNGYAVDDPNRQRDWDMLLRMNMPIFDGGRISGRVAERQAELLKQQSISAEQARLAEREVRESYVLVEHSREAYKQAQLLSSARKKSLDSQRTDYKNGLVTNLDVISALTLVQRAELDLLDARYNYINNVVRLYVSAGEVIK